MRHLAPLFAFAAIIATVGFACGNGKAPGNPDAGDDDAADGPLQTFSFKPAGCGYTISPPATRAFEDLAVDDTSAPGGDITPARVRLGLGGGTDSSDKSTYADPHTSVSFTWETPTASHAAKVKLGTAPDTLGDLHTGYTWTTPKPTIGLSSANPKFMHEVHVCGLQPGTTYYYQVGGGPSGSETWSATQQFTTVPATGTITVGIQGDARDQVSTWQTVQERMLSAGVSMQLVVGDIVDIGTLEDLWTQWLDAIWKDPNDSAKFLTLGQQLLVPIAGNHENEAAQFYGNWSIPGDSEQYASFDVGNTHFVMVDDEFAQLQTDYTQAPASTILAWLDADLKAANQNRANVPFIVAMNHRGLFSTSNHSTDGDVLAARGQLAPIFDKYAVDVVFNGHDHEYERSKPVKAGSPATGDPVVGSVDGSSNPVSGTGTTYVICAGAGAEPYSTGEITKSYSLKQQGFGGSTKYIGTYSILTMSANTLQVDAYGLVSSGTDDKIDSFTLTH